jgi:hypothetical protein
VLFRFVAGFAIGIQSINNDTFMSEMCPVANWAPILLLHRGFTVVTASATAS